MIRPMRKSLLLLAIAATACAKKTDTAAFPAAMN